MKTPDTNAPPPPDTNRAPAHVPSHKYDDMTCLSEIVAWWDGLPPRLRQDIEGSGAEPGCIAKARRLFANYSA
jgi:hypothetical protein